MRATTLHQPYATLCAMEVKRVETRSWPAPPKLIGQRIAIHAGKTVSKDVNYATRKAAARYSIPRGAVLATAVLDKVLLVDHLTVDQEDGKPYAYAAPPRQPMYQDRVEIDPYGDFSIGRYLWLLSDVKRLREPMPCRGFQGFWEWDDSGAVYEPDGQYQLECRTCRQICPLCSNRLFTGSCVHPAEIKGMDMVCYEGHITPRDPVKEMDYAGIPRLF